jgi:hypothetical protein
MFLENFAPLLEISGQKALYPLIGVRSRPLYKHGIEPSLPCFT